MSNKLPIAVSAIVVALFAWYYFIFRAMAPSLGFVNAVVAFSAVVILTFSFLIGPLARFIPFFRNFLAHRKAFGLIGYALAGLHIIIVVPLLIGESNEITFADVASLAVAAVAFTIFTLMALTSTSRWVTTLGYENWKNLQRTGYLALIFVLFHVALLEKGVFFSRLTGQIAIGIILLALLLRAIALVIGKPSAEKIKV
ncbi:MAG TPA: ferric reductase-like transmembrane domain-containing protein [archaeon]|nr:ferric reductase-like transmembrane domain-containing protein [archaeon]